MPTPEAALPSVQLLQMITGHWVAQIVASVARLGAADEIARGRKRSPDLATALGVNPDGLYRLLRAGATLGLFREGPQQTFELTPIGELLRNDVPGSLRHFAIAELDTTHWLPWGRLAEAVQTGRSVATKALGCFPWEYYARHPEDETHFGIAMSNLSSLVAAQAATVIDLKGVRHIVDVGGSQGILLAALLRAAPEADGVLFDQPQVVARSESTLKREGVFERVQRVGGDFFETVPAGGDLYLLKHIIHDWDDERAERILRNCRNAVSRGGRLTIIEMHLTEPPAEASIAPLMDLNMLVMLDGRERTRAEYDALLGKAGFRLERDTLLPPTYTMIEARPT